MLCLKVTFAALILASVAQHFLQAEARKGQQERKGRGRVEQAVFSPKPTSPGNERKSSGRAASKGKFSTKDRMQCNWSAMEDQALVLSISCTMGNESFHCEYVANPGACHQYESSSERSRKKITRSLKKQKNLCRDPKGMVKATVCKNARNEVHFSLRSPTKAQHLHQPQPRNKNCKGLSDREKLAKEYCSSSWSSVCTFFFAMVENENC